MKIYFLFWALALHAVFSNNTNKYCTIATCARPNDHSMCRYETWDKELEDIAQRWAFQCKLHTDWCRDVERFHVGQSLGYKEYDRTPSSVEQLPLKYIITTWYDEVQRFDSSVVEEFKTTKIYVSYSPHYTQMVWSNSHRIGCGVISYKKNEEYNPTLYIVCNNGRRGNVESVPVYDTKGEETDY